MSVNDLFSYSMVLPEPEKGCVYYYGCTLKRGIGSWMKGDSVHKIKITRAANNNTITIYDKVTYNFTSEPVEHIKIK